MTDTTPRTSLRDRIAWWGCNLILRSIATPWYRDRITFYVRYGMARAAADAQEGEQS